MEIFLEKSNPVAHEFPPGSNCYVVFLKSTDFLLNVQIDVNIQRELSEDWIDDLKGRILMNYEAKGYFQFGQFDLACFKNSLYLLNGQHRLRILKDIQNQYDNIDLEVKIYNVASEDEMNEIFMLVNGSKPSQICKSISKQIIVNGIKKYFVKNYPKYVTTAKKPQKPHINLDFLCDNLVQYQVLEKLKIESVEDFTKMLEEVNTFYKYTDAETWKKWHIDDNIILKCKTKNIMRPLFLGLYNQSEYFLRMIEMYKQSEPANDYYKSIPHYLLNAKSRKISQSKRRIVWEKRNGHESLIGKCFVCERQLDYDLYVVGHIKSFFFGGDTSIDNLESICTPCNLSMSTENLLDYKRKFNNI
jgi:hypothetical protein